MLPSFCHRLRAPHGSFKRQHSYTIFFLTACALMASCPSPLGPAHNAADERPPKGVCSIRLCTPGMGMNLWGESPLYENLKVFIVMMDTNRSTSRRQGRLREEGSEGSRSANVRARACPGPDPVDRNRREGSVSGRASHTWQSPQVHGAG